MRALAGRTQPVLLDLGPIVGENVTFFGEACACKQLVENLFADLDRHAREGTLDALPAFLERRLSNDDNSVDGILCWDLFDALEPAAARALAVRLARILKPDGVLMAFFATPTRTESTSFGYTKFASSPDGAAGAPGFTRYVIVSPDTMEYRPYAAVRTVRAPWVNRDIERTFAPLRVSDQFLLKTHLREILFRKPAATLPANPDTPETTP